MQKESVVPGMVGTLGAAIVLLVAVTAVAQTPATGGGAQSPAAGVGEEAAKGLKTLALVGCVVRDQEGAPLRLSDGFGDSVKLEGGDLSPFVGKKVRVVGTGDSKRLTFRFGLYPSPNIAAQAGGINPVRAAEAAMPGGPAHGTGNVTLPELRVKIIRTMPGTCP